MHVQPLLFHHTLNQNNLLACKEKLEDSPHLGAIPRYVGKNAFAFDPVYYEGSLIILLTTIIEQLSLYRKELAQMGMNLHNKINEGKNTHEKMTIYVEMQAALLGDMKANLNLNDSSITLVSTEHAKWSKARRPQITAWYNRLGVLGEHRYIDNLSYKEIVSHKEELQRKAADALAQSGNMRSRILASHTKYSTLMAVYSSLQGVMRKLLTGIASGRSS